MSNTRKRASFHSDPEIMSGESVFTGTRVPVRHLIDYLEGGETIDGFFGSFPSVKREQVISFMETARDEFLASAW